MKQLLFCLLATCVGSVLASAHVLDQYLQVAQIDLTPGRARIDLRMTPGVQVADRIFALIDADGDGRCSDSEAATYARRVSAELEFAVNGVSTPLTLTAQQFPGRDEMREGIGAIRLSFAAPMNVASGDQQIFFRNNHQPELGAYLVNALAPSTNEIRITGQQRDPLQREVRLSFQVAAADSRRARIWAGSLMLCLFLALLIWKWRKSSPGPASGAADHTS